MTDVFSTGVLTVTRSALAYLALLCGVLSLVPGMAVVGAAAIVLAILLGWRELRLVARIIFGLLVAMSALALVDEPSALMDGAVNMTRLTALILTVMLLSSLLGRSRDLEWISASLFAGRPTARYLSVSFGTTVLSVPLNFGSVGVVSSMIAGQVRRHGDSAMARNACRGTLRGFGASPTCSPLSISVVMTVTFLPGLHSWELISFSLPLATVYLLSGLLFIEREEPGPAQLEITASGWQRYLPWVRFSAIIGVICLGAFVLSGPGGLSYSKAVTLSCLSMVGLLFVHTVATAPAGQRNPLPSMAPVSNELVIVGGSAFLGALISSFALKWLGAGFILPGWGYPLVAALVPWVFFCGGMLGLNPIVIGTLTGGVLGPIWPVESVLGLGIGMVSGWGITTGGTPYSANSLLMERVTGYSARVAAFRWNLSHSVVSLLAGGLLAATMTWMLAP
ncbi:hypothetical protein SAMN05216203_2071 [Marinobacter daqiaonensis]|uniref:Uncharacterized protein n=1 Tax=Marinobacter daqiaonensis TaxID=650891 RepID=A0A1I6IBP1_9GAMM|nr:hypothetical protein [Marinobacter daqiaonensis]SFR64044.1 hypothetical protein SAMN05216203_2071 [Marinobacter daqiaonensis]